MKEAELIKKYGLDLEALKREQLKLSKNLQIKDSINFSSAERIGAIENIIVKNKIIAAIIVCDKEFNIIEQQYFLDSLRFPYIHGFRAYREMPSMISAFNKLSEKPDVVFIHGHGLSHCRLGLASHFSLSVNVPCIGVASSPFEENKIQGEDILLNDKKVGKILQSKQESNPIYISPGNLISVKSAFELCKRMIKEPHKLPEPLHLAHKYAKQVRDELKL
jgi:deoxyribonuclease V